MNIFELSENLFLHDDDINIEKKQKKIIVK
jgi:hypothetical protein